MLLFFKKAVFLSVFWVRHSRSLQLRSFTATNIDISQLPSGFYILRLITAEGYWGAKTFVKR